MKYLDSFQSLHCLLNGFNPNHEALSPLLTPQWFKFLQPELHSILINTVKVIHIVRLPWNKQSKRFSGTLRCLRGIDQSGLNPRAVHWGISG